MSHKHHVTIEECIDEEAAGRVKQHGTTPMDDIDLGRINQSQMSITDDLSSSGSKSQAWEEVDTLEEKARCEKMQDQSTAMANAGEAARIVKQAQQSSDY